MEVVDAENLTKESLLSYLLGPRMVLVKNFVDHFLSVCTFPFNECSV